MGIKPEQLAAEITKQLRIYSTGVEEGMEELKDRVTDEGVKTLKSTSPRKKGKYARGWRKKKEGSARIIHNATDYQLTHLLEKGHAKRNGGRVAGKPHIEPVEEMIIEQFEKGAIEVIHNEFN